MADTTEKLDIVFNVTGLEESNAKLVQANSSVEKLFRQLSETGEEIETPFLKGIDSINRLRGNLDDVTDQFKLFGERGTKIAESLEKITDPAKRLQLSTTLLNKEMANSNGVFAKLGNKTAELQARFHALSPAAKGALLGVAAGAAAAAAGAVKLAQIVSGQLVDAWKKWASQSAEAIRIQEDLDSQTDRLQVSLGKLIEESAHVTDAQVGYGKAASDVGEIVDSLTKKITSSNEASSNAFNVLSGYTDVVVELGRKEKERLGLIQATNPLLLTQSALMDQLAASSLQAGTGLETVETAMKDAAIEAWKLNQALDELDKRWSDSAFGAQNALGATTEAGGSARATQSQRAQKGQEAEKKRLDEIGDALEEQADKAKKIAEQRQKDLEAITKMNAEFEKTKQLSGGNQQMIDKYQDDPTVQAFEKLKADMQAANAEAGELSFINAEKLAQMDAGTQQVMQLNGAMNDAAKSALMLGVNMAAMALETAVAGDSFAGFGWKMLQMFGSFASQAGQVILATGIGELALFQGNPGGAIAAGLSLIAIGSVLGGIAKRNLKKDSPKSSGAAQANQITDRFARQNRDQNQEPQPIIVYAQFGTERLEPAIANAVTSAQRNGRLPRN